MSIGGLPIEWDCGFGDSEDIVPNYRNGMSLTIFLDGTYRFQSELDAHYASQCEPDYVTSIPLTELVPYIKDYLT